MLEYQSAQTMWLQASDPVVAAVVVAVVVGGVVSSVSAATVVVFVEVGAACGRRAQFEPSTDWDI